MVGLRQLLLASVIVSVILVSGCINMEIRQKIRADGISEMQLTYDLSAITQLPDQLGDATVTPPDIDELRQNVTQTCDEFSADAGWSNVQCSVTDDFKVLISGEYSLKDSPALEITPSLLSTTYRYNVKNVYNTLSDVSETQGQEFSEDQLEQAKSMAGLMNMKMEYVIEMPGAITHADIGEVEGNTVTIDIFDLAGTGDVYVESQETNIALLGAVAGIVVIILIVIVLVVRRGRGSAGSARPAGQQPPGSEAAVPSTDPVPQANT